MNFLKILLCAMFIFAISACGEKKDNHYDYPDEDVTAEKGNIGDSCAKNDDCKEGLVCSNKKCQEPATDDENIDSDSEVEDGDIDSDPTDDNTDTDTNINDDEADTGEPTSDDEADTGEPTSDDDADTDEPIYVPECGNGMRDPGEECDNGLDNSDEPGIQGITCRIDCYFARCGDGILDVGELCDDGNFASGDYCSPDCNVVTGYCGDGIKQINEVCDYAEDPYCSDDCSELLGFCGDGIKQPNEICDNAEPDVGAGEGIGPYYCNLNCTEIIGSCGDEEVQINEECDDGDYNGRYGYCNSDCSGLGEHCGDGIKQINEVCDDGENNGIYCSEDCQTSFGACGDGIIQSFEVCDKAKFGDGIGAYCSGDCTQIIGYCGDGTTQRENCGGFDNCTVVEGLDEECDNGTGNNNPYCPYGSALGCSVCSTSCKQTPGIPRYCGDGVVSTLAGEVCDKANFGDGIGEYCSNDCTQIVGSCGDGIKQPNEVCDKANFGEGIGAYCSDDCKTITGSCGDGTKQANEECDFGVNNGKTNCAYGETSCEICTTSCKIASGNTSYCGDGIKQGEYEECDHGLDNGTYGHCKADCSGLGERCGDGIVNGSEECDEGPLNGKTECDYGPQTCNVCSVGCKETNGTAKYCGDGIVNGSEACDDGALNGTYGHCDANCYGAGERCGDGITNGSEACDDGELNGTYGHCKTDCSGIGERCGDGIKQPNEVCDDGINNGQYKLASPGYCNSTCDGYGEGGYCGDNTQQAGEGCDNGSDNGKANCDYGLTDCQVCNSNCQLRSGNPSYCGDGAINSANGEVCDDGPLNTEYGGYCNTSCTGYSPRCGDGITDTEHGEMCDDGVNNGKYSQNAPGYCDSDCHGIGTSGYCGDGTLNGFETCDSGVANGTYGGNCNSNCNGYTPYCGDGTTDFSYGEICDSGANNGNYNFCNNDCSAWIVCGDGIINGDEDCDEGEGTGSNLDCVYGETSCTVCSSSCKNIGGNTSFCGDNIIDSNHNETCDEGANNGTYGHCNSTCNGDMPRCGDGNTDTTYGETCDDGPLNGTYGHCNISCNGIVQCGDGIKSDGEYCDDGPLNGTYGHCNTNCTAVVGSCGDGIFQSEDCTGKDNCVVMPGATEECDFGAYNGQTHCNYGQTNCTVCTYSCKTASGITSYCGDGIQDNSFESCDDGALNGTYGYCSKDCSEKVTWICGDEKVDYNHGEVCDDGTNNGLQGYCNSTCTGLTPYCGDGVINRESCKGYDNCVEAPGMNEECDDGTNNDYVGYCHPDCSGYCGDGIIQSTFEMCDDGENNGNEGYCDSTCSYICGNGIVESDEVCDEGPDNGKYYNHCDNLCKGTKQNGYCGDGKLQVADVSECGSLPECDENTTENCCEIVLFATGESSETCDDGDKNGYHGYCNETCDGTSSCGDGIIGKDEFCEQGGSLTTVPCAYFSQFSSGFVTSCDTNCMPILTGCTNNASYTSPFFEAGQTNCYDDSGIISCPALESDPFYGQEPNFNYTAQNFELMAGAEDKIVFDNTTGIMWQKDTPPYYGFVGKESEIIYTCAAETSCTLAEAEAICNSSYIGQEGYWRLPTAAEFSTIMKHEGANHLHSLFTNSTGSYWTSDGMLFSADDGTTSTATSGSTAQVKCVRFLNELWNSCRAFQCSGNAPEQILDFPDSIIALYNYNKNTFVNIWYFGAPMNSENWENALDLCKNIDNNGINNMRLPTVNELMSLVDKTNGGSLISGFSGKAWTSTTVSNLPVGHPLEFNANSYAYAVDFSTGNIVYEPKNNYNAVICIE